MTLEYDILPLTSACPHLLSRTEQAFLLTAGSPQLPQMLVDDIGDVTITNDGATILKLLEIEHPAAKVMLLPSL